MCKENCTAAAGTLIGIPQHRYYIDGKHIYTCWGKQVGEHQMCPPGSSAAALAVYIQLSKKIVYKIIHRTCFNYLSSDKQT